MKELIRLRPAPGPTGATCEPGSHFRGVGDNFQISGFYPLHSTRHGLSIKGLRNDAIFQGHPHHAAIILKSHLPTVSRRDVVLDAFGDPSRMNTNHSQNKIYTYLYNYTGKSIIYP